MVYGIFVEEESWHDICYLIWDSPQLNMWGLSPLKYGNIF